MISSWWNPEAQKKVNFDGLFQLVYISSQPEFEYNNNNNKNNNNNNTTNSNNNNNNTSSNNKQQQQQHQQQQQQQHIWSQKKESFQR